ncbi:MAG: hypothetical protein JKX78_11040 [Alteromonadaceae bacterium]|nr:hypothetical protein [Alteromonadaceae bacterium]
MNLLVKWTVLCCLLLSSSHAFALVNNSFTQPDIKINQQTFNLISKQTDKQTIKDKNERRLTNSNTIALIQFKQTREIYNFSGEALYRYGHFSAKSSITQNQSNDIAYYLQSAYLVFNDQNIAVSLEAKIENFSNYTTKELQLFNVNLVNNIDVRQQTTYKANSLAVTGSYKVNKNWHVTGTLSSTTVNESALNTKLNANAREEIAIIGTSYSF